MIRFPSKDEITHVLVTNVLGPGKTMADLPNQWVLKHLLLGLREVMYALVVVLKLVSEQGTVQGAKGKMLEELGYEYGVDRKQATPAIHQVTLQKSNPVRLDTPVPDHFLVTTTPYGNHSPVQFRVVPGQHAQVLLGQTSVRVSVACVQPGSIGNVPAGGINLVAQAGFDAVTDSGMVSAGTEAEEDDAYRARILEKKRNPGRGGTASDYKIWAESVDGVVSALVLPRNRGDGTVDIIITGVNGMPDLSLVQACQCFMDTKTPADLADEAVQVMAPTSIPINVNLEHCVWATGFSAATGVPMVQEALRSYISKTANTERIVRVMDIITVAKQAFDNRDSSQTPVLLDFIVTDPTINRTLGKAEMAVPGTLSITS